MVMVMMMSRIMMMSMPLMWKSDDFCYDGRDVDHVYNMSGHFALYFGYL